MATELTVQSERAFQKQPHIFLNTKAKASSKKSAQGRRWYKDVGLGFRTPKAAIEGTYIDHKCPFTGTVSIRGRVLTGKVVSTKMHRTLVIRREYLHYVPKYNRYERRHKNLSAHVSPAFRVEEGDTVTVGQCRPLSKTVRFSKASRSVVRLPKTQACDFAINLRFWFASTCSRFSPPSRRPVSDDNKALFSWSISLIQFPSTVKSFAKF
ncbi:unnamed protein product [Penicillium salamii]|nr:unnamed protein product [Penicillium salamii]CAG8387056.1 unnamed protein product [Penicillium salamii]